MADNSPRTDTSTDLEADAKLDDGHHHGGTTGVLTMYSVFYPQFECEAVVKGQVSQIQNWA
jgi:hypothetical protein